mmetsp:Transcript_85474/g.227940  ORF Transcript_85474/g.227940 Transcript_85474/m.227940 type:complete len:101 (-) Transcript_85474:107-409(-)
MTYRTDDVRSFPHIALEYSSFKLCREGWCNNFGSAGSNSSNFNPLVSIHPGNSWLTRSLNQSIKIEPFHFDVLHVVPIDFDEGRLRIQRKCSLYCLDLRK